MMIPNPVRLKFDQMYVLVAKDFKLKYNVPVLVVMMLCYGVRPDLLTLVPNAVVVIISLMSFSVGIGYAHAAINVYFRDLERIMGIVLMMWMFASPVFIPIQSVPEKWLWVYRVNPAALILVSHSMDDIRKYCTRVIRMDHEHVVADGPTEEVLGE